MQLQIEYLSVTDLKPYDKNTRKHKKLDVDNIAKSIEKYGMNDAIGIWGEDNVIVEGHGRLEACKKLGIDTVPVVRLDHLSDEQRREYAIAHNATAELSEWDLDILPDELAELDLSDFDFDFGIEDEEEETKIVEDEAPEVDEDAEPITKLGDIWQLGRHRLMCGSSTDETDVSKLMNGNSAKMLFTSPPYSDMREYNGGKDLSVNNIARFIPTYRAYTDYQCVNLGLQRKNHEIVQYWDEYISIAKDCGYKLMAWNVWDKPACISIGQQSAFFPIRHEWIFVFGTEFFEINLTWEKKAENIKEAHTRASRQADGSTKFSTTGDTSKTHKQMESVLSLLPELGAIRSEHPATFPVGLPSEYIKAMTKKGDGVIEPFCGSGTTLIACEQLDRVCYGMELDPKYCDVIIKRWETLTGEKAVLIND